MVTNQLVAFPDFVPTLSEITGVSFSQLGITDGMSFNAVLNGASSSSRDYIFNHYRPLIAKSNKIPIRYVLRYYHGFLYLSNAAFTAG